MSVRFTGNAIFTSPNWNRILTFSLHISFIFKHQFYKYFVSRSVGQAKKGINVKTWKCHLIFLTPISIFCSSYILSIISNSFATYGCCHPCYVYQDKLKLEQDVTGDEADAAESKSKKKDVARNLFIIQLKSSSCLLLVEILNSCFLLVDNLTFLSFIGETFIFLLSLIAKRLKFMVLTGGKYKNLFDILKFLLLIGWKMKILFFLLVEG